MQFVRRVSVAAALSILSVPVMADYTSYSSTVTSTPGLVAYFPLNSSSSGTTSSSDGTYTGTLAGNAAIMLGAAAPITGNPGGLSLPNNPDSGSVLTTNLSGGVTTAGTILSWVKLSSEPSDTGRTYYIAGESQNGNDFDLQIETDDALKFYTAGGSHVTYGSGMTTSPALTVGQWYFIAATFDSSTNTDDIYLNGNLVATANFGSSTSQRGAFDIGESSVFGGRDFDGAIDDVAVYSAALTQAQVSSLANAAGLPEPTCLIAAGMWAVGLLARRRRR